MARFFNLCRTFTGRLGEFILERDFVAANDVAAGNDRLLCPVVKDKVFLSRPIIDRENKRFDFNRADFPRLVCLRSVRPRKVDGIGKFQRDRVSVGVLRVEFTRCIVCLTGIRCNVKFERTLPLDARRPARKRNGPQFAVVRQSCVLRFGKSDLERKDVPGQGMRFAAAACPLIVIPKLQGNGIVSVRFDGICCLFARKGITGVPLPVRRDRDGVGRCGDRLVVVIGVAGFQSTDKQQICRFVDRKTGDRPGELIVFGRSRRVVDPAIVAVKAEFDRILVGVLPLVAAYKGVCLVQPILRRRIELYGLHLGIVFIGFVCKHGIRHALARDLPREFDRVVFTGLCRFAAPDIVVAEFDLNGVVVDCIGRERARLRIDGRRVRRSRHHGSDCVLRNIAGELSCRRAVGIEHHGRCGGLFDGLAHDRPADTGSGGFPCLIVPPDIVGFALGVFFQRECDEIVAGIGCRKVVGFFIGIVCVCLLNERNILRISIVRVGRSADRGNGDFVGRDLPGDLRRIHVASVIAPAVVEVRERHRQLIGAGVLRGQLAALDLQAALLGGSGHDVRIKAIERDGAVSVRNILRVRSRRSGQALAQDRPGIRIARVRLRPYKIRVVERKADRICAGILDRDAARKHGSVLIDFDFDRVRKDAALQKIGFDDVLSLGNLIEAVKQARLAFFGKDAFRFVECRFYDFERDDLELVGDVDIVLVLPLGIVPFAFLDGERDRVSIYVFLRVVPGNIAVLLIGLPGF